MTAESGSAAGRFRLRTGVQLEGKILCSYTPLSVTTVNTAAASVVSALETESFLPPETVADRAGLDTAAVRDLCEQLHKRAFLEWAPARDSTYRPSVSVVVTTLDATGDVGPCLDALASLEYLDYEVIVVDGGSTDGTVDVVREHGLTSGRQLRVLEAGRPANPLSIGAGRNRGAAAADGDVVAFTDADCRPRPEWLSDLVPVLANHDVVGGRIRPYRDPTAGDRGLLARGATLYEGYASSLDMGPRNARVDPSSNTPYVPTANLLCRRDVVDSLRFPDRNVAEDVSLCWRAIESGFDVVYSASGVVEHEFRDRPRVVGARNATYAQSEALLGQEFGYDDGLTVPAVPLLGVVLTAVAFLSALVGVRGWTLGLLTAAGVGGLGVPTVWKTATALRRLRDVLPASAVVTGVLRSAASVWYSVAREVARYYSGPLAVSGLLVVAAGVASSSQVLTAAGSTLVGIGVVAVVLPLTVEVTTRRPVYPGSYAFWWLLDSGSYQLGAYAGAIEYGTVRHLVPWRRFTLT